MNEGIIDLVYIELFVLFDFEINSIKFVIIRDIVLFYKRIKLDGLYGN